MTLTEFLLARIAEDEEVAKDAALTAGGIGYGNERIDNGKAWAARYHEVVRPVVPGVTDRRTIADCGGFGGLGIAPHIARHDPARVLAQCAAHRAIVEQAQNEVGPTAAEDWLFPLLALPYADHPDYREEWRP